MALEFVLDKIASRIGTFRLLRAFVENDLSDLLEALGVVEYRAAIRAFRDMSTSSRPDRELDSGITLLRSAYEVFITVSIDESLLSALRDAFLSALTLGIKEPTRLRCGELAVQTAFILQVAYVIAGDAKQAAVFKGRALCDFDRYAELYAAQESNAAGMSGNQSYREIRKHNALAEMKELKDRLANICNDLSEVA